MRIIEKKINSRSSLSLYNNIYNTNIIKKLYYPPLYNGFATKSLDVFIIMVN